MIKNLTELFNIPELRKKIFFTLIIIAIYRLGIAIPTPGIDGEALKMFFANQNNTLFGFLDMFSGGALNKFSIFSMGVMPYINSSIIMSLLQTIIPYFEKLSREGEEGRKKLIQISRYGTLILGIIQSFGLTFMIQAMRAPNGNPVVLDPGMSFQLLSVLTLTTGTVFIMWMGEQITEKGIGNGISMIIFAGIIDRLPGAAKNVVLLLQSDGISLLKVIITLAVVILVTALVVKVEQGQRRIPIQYPKRSSTGNMVAGGQTSFLPIKVDQSGVIAVIFAISIISFPITIAQFFPEAPMSKHIFSLWQRAGALYHIVYGLLIIFFCYFYTSITFNPYDLAENIKKSGGFIPGIRPGEDTGEYIEKIIIRITFFGSIFIALLAIMPDILRSTFNIPFYFGGTALLIVVGVALDVLSKLESYLIMRHYDGFMEQGRVKGRYFSTK
ncbi:MAG: preprotein translocase subunit SecY [Elusimicrobiota bacterium]|jgi:preprotein translocase subunit SecY|nr:preprotein translocase subunit SecY [Elusimicrobiota bacterium]